ncbi:female-specific protein transformer-like [Venturia canescens]|uniref:female-specific protein transformer-like n=1 Tax=Venturia canescens TaxID=32260 RepID=UPI001C9C29B7|nr:female-specific protein transformer-like [Venturia canescens]
MKRIGSGSDVGSSRSSRLPDYYPSGRELEEKERRRREWRRQQELEREHERLKREKIEEYERKRRAQELKNDRRRSSRRSKDRSRSSSPNDRHKRETEKISTSKSAVMSQKLESSSSNGRLFNGPEGTKIDLTELRRIKVDIHRNLTTTETSNELQREIVDPEDVKVKRRQGEGSKPIFEREELKKPIDPASEVEERRTVVSVSDLKTERRKSSPKKRSASPTSPSARSSVRRHTDSHDSRYENFRRHADRHTEHRSHKQSGESDRGRSKEHRARHESDDTRRHRSLRKPSHDASQDHRDRRNRSHSADRQSRRSETRSRSNREVIPHRDHRENSRDDSRDRRNRNDRSRERRMQMPHHYADAMPVPLYYESFHPRPIMIGPMMPMPGQMPMSRGGMRPMMAPMRPPYPPRFFPPEMYRQAPHPNSRFARMF